MRLKNASFRLRLLAITTKATWASEWHALKTALQDSSVSTSLSRFRISRLSKSIRPSRTDFITGNKSNFSTKSNCKTRWNFREKKNVLSSLKSWRKGLCQNILCQLTQIKSPWLTSKEETPSGSRAKKPKRHSWTCIWINSTKLSTLSTRRSARARRWSTSGRYKKAGRTNN